MYNTTIIIPIHKLEDSDCELLNKALVSLTKQKDSNFKVAIVIPSTLDARANELKIEEVIEDSFEFSWVLNTGDTNYQSQVNFAVDNIDTEYFSVLQYDDELLDNYVMNVNKYIAAYGYDIFLPIEFEVDGNSDFIGFSNEAVWSLNHMDKFGHFDLSNTKKHSYVNYNMCGATIKKQSFEEAGKFKASMVKYHDYEFLLRMLNLGNVAYVIPKLMYKHVNGRDGSLHDSLKGMLEDEHKFWYELARKEYHFDDDRDISFSRA